jgi:hypothetical protein
MLKITVKENQNGGNFPPLEAGSYRAICYGIVVLGTTYNPVFDNAQTKILFLWELPDERIEVNNEDKPRAISNTYTLSLNEKANLRQMLAGWRGRDFTEEELQGFDLVNVLGAPCLLSTTIGVSKQGREFAKVSSVAKLPKGMIVPKETENEKVIFDITNAECPLEEMEKLPEWIQTRIKESVEYKQRVDTSDFEIISDDEDLPFD